MSATLGITGEDIILADMTMNSFMAKTAALTSIHDATVGITELVTTANHYHTCWAGAHILLYFAAISWYLKVLR